MDKEDTLPQYPIRTVARRTGLSPHVLRAWERRYGVVDPARQDRNQRLYSNADILRLRLVRQLSDAGHAIGGIARMSMGELRRLADAERAVEAWESATRDPAELHLAEALAAVTVLDDSRLHTVLARAAVRLPAGEFIEGVAMPLLGKAGDLWAEGEICPAHEHALSVQIGRVLGWLFSGLPAPEGASRAVAGTLSGERHEFGALAAGLVAAEEGWRVTYLGPDLPIEHIATAVELRRAELILLSMVMERERSSLLSELKALRAAVGRDPQILIGGHGAEPHASAVEESGCASVIGLGELRHRVSATLTMSIPA